jgi:hypothetical protein
MEQASGQLAVNVERQHTAKAMTLKKGKVAHPASLPFRAAS